MITVRTSAARGHANHGWLDSHHTFSFGDYRDPAHMGFRTLRVINEDRVAPGGGFPTHGHSDMEIISYVISGGLEHRDSLGNGAVIRPGEIQRMSAGTGVRHSEFNASQSEPVHFLQIWIVPEAAGAAAGYEQVALPPVADGETRVDLIASRQGGVTAVTVHQDVAIHRVVLAATATTNLELASGRYAWMQVVKGDLSLNGTTLATGDGAAVSDETVLQLASSEGAEALVFDLG
jgi:quercetin 2,3-dioxygenase